MLGERKRTIKLFCPSLSKVVSLVAWEEQRLDLGFIARSFGLDPSTLKLNGHFISRGVDLIASSVTWKCLLSFFSVRGLSTGATDDEALIVDGKLSKVGTKRVHNSTDGIPSVIQCENASISRNSQLEDTNLLKRKRLWEYNSGDEYGIKCNGLEPSGLKRKQCLEDIDPLKRLRGKESDSGFSGREDGIHDAISKAKFQCSYTSEHVKRMREDEVFATTSSKRSR